jgi:hypothetical protein
LKCGQLDGKALESRRKASSDSSQTKG